MSSNLRLERAPAKFRVRARASGLSRDSVVNVSQLITVDKPLLTERIGRLAPDLLRDVDLGIRLVLAA
jgi:mRNA interferase MazF